MEIIKPINTGNSKFIYETCYPMIQLAMLRYEALFDHYSEEPKSIYIKLEEDGEKFGFEQILRIRRWTNNEKSYSWNIYSQEREWSDDGNGNSNEEPDTLGNLIIRHVVWDMRLDLSNIEKFSNSCRERLIEYWPSIHTKNIFLDFKSSRALMEQIFEFDKTIENGILLALKSNPEWRWRDLEIKRLFDWGQIHTTWSPTKTNQKVEDSILKIEEIFKEHLISDYADIHSMDLNFSIDPVTYKDMVIGKKNR